MKSDVMKAVKSFQTNGYFLRGCNASLIPKSRQSHKFGQV